jgi:hypothetical protein
MDDDAMAGIPRWGDPPGPKPEGNAPRLEAVCFRCEGSMTDLQISPGGGPWVCLACARETLETARTRYTLARQSPSYPDPSAVLVLGGRTQESEDDDDDWTHDGPDNA